MPASFANPPVTNPSISPNNNRITSAGWGYDAAGNTLTDAGAQTYVYDGENKMVKASLMVPGKYRPRSFNEASAEISDSTVQPL